MNKPMAYAIAGAMALPLVFGFSGASLAAQKPVVFEVAFNQPETHPQFQAMKKMGEALKARTNGAYSIEVFPNELLGAQKETVEMVQTGTIAMSITAGSLLESWNPDFAVFNLPYMFTSIDQQKKVVNDPEIVGELYNSIADKGIVVLGAFHGGVRNVYLKKGPVKEPADLAGLKVRVMQSDTNIKMLNMMGGSGISMGQGDVYTAIQTGVLDGGENNEIVFSSLKQVEVAPYYSYTRHLMMPDYLVINTKLYKGLPADVKKIFDEELAKAIDTEYALFAEAVAKSKADAEKAGGKFNEADVAAFKKAVAPLTEEKLTSPVTKAIYAKIQKMQ